MNKFEPINLSVYADPILDELVSGVPKIDGTRFFDIIAQTRGPILELGCGYGRITIPLAQHGIADLTGLELCAPSLAYARVKAGDLPIRWVQADVRDFHLGQQYALIFARGAVFDFMLTRPDQEALLACVREHLAEGGRFMFDTCDKPLHQMTNTVDEVAWFTINHPNGRQIYVSGTEHFDYANQLWFQKCYERWDGSDGELVRKPWELTLRYTMPQDIETLLHYNGFKVVYKAAEYDGTPATAEKPASWFICERR